MMKPYIAHFAHGWHTAWNNRSDLVTSIIMYIVLLAVFGSVFRIMPIHELGFATITAHHLMWYVAATELVIVASNGGHRDMGSLIAEGQLTIALRRPVHLVGMVFARVMGEAMLQACVLTIVAFIALQCVSGVAIPITLNQAIFYAPLFMVSFTLAMSILMVLGFMVGFLEVYGPHSRSASWIVMKVVFTFGGLFFPILFFPKWLQTIVYLTPAPAILFIPAQFMLEPSLADIIKGLGLQVIWLVVLIGACAMVERRITRHVLTVGD